MALNATQHHSQHPHSEGIETLVSTTLLSHYWLSLLLLVLRQNVASPLRCRTITLYGKMHNSALLTLMLRSRHMGWMVEVRKIPMLTTCHQDGCMMTELVM